MASFTSLPVYDGEGPYHFNRYRITFQKQGEKSQQDYARDFVTRFPYYFNSEWANVERIPDEKFEDKPVLKFHGFSKVFGIDIASAHHDWVVQFALDPNAGFTVQTLERLFREWEDAELAGEGALAGGAIGGAVGNFGGPVGATVGGVAGAIVGSVPAYNANFKHFLAGRRAWRLDSASTFGIAGDYYVLETAAVERFSCKFYSLNSKVQNLQEKIPLIWNTMLTNYATRNRLIIAPKATPPGWKCGGFNLSTDFFPKTFEKIDDLRRDREFQSAIRIYPHLIPPNLLP